MTIWAAAEWAHEKDVSGGYNVVKRRKEGVNELERLTQELE